MESTAVDYFSNVYSMDHDIPVMDICQSLEHINIPKLTNQEQADLLSPITPEEVETAIFKMKSDKASGPDEQQKDLVGVKFARRGPTISHLMYADDTILFFKADDINCALVKKAIDMYANLAGQQLNYDKSFLVFSPNTSRVVKYRIAQNLGVAISTKIGRYLGTFVDNRLSDPQNYSALVERIGNKLAGWKAKTLSQAGRLTLIKSDQVLMDAAVLPKPGYISLIKGCFLHYSEAIISRDVLDLVCRQNILLRLVDVNLLHEVSDLEHIMPQYIFSGLGPFFMRQFFRSRDISLLSKGVSFITVKRSFREMSLISFVDKTYCLGL
ncbi:reverse transcriptase [Senna tora]|uniref:Reverse transcriptase n=1 Tax=Senna tora TaxID=362788 RepID=A0A834SD96_9FABA|nr:reverse transcriptase [Senna tora]